MQRVAFIGAGNMANALVRGLLQQGVNASQIAVADPMAEQLKVMRELGVTTYADNQSAVNDADVVVLAVKPQIAQRALDSVTLTPTQLLLSIAAGIECASLNQWTSPTQPVIRCMPNTPALLGAGITALYANSHCETQQRTAAADILAAAGEVLWVKDESLLDAVTAVSGSGPAYFFYLMEAMIEAGTDLGLPPETATQLTLQTALGAARMALETGESAAQLRHNVTSPGGTTEAALSTLAEHDFKPHVTHALNAAAQRATQLAEEFGKTS